jgi:N-acetylglucosamine kinase-like BadF-type ATPase
LKFQKTTPTFETLKMILIADSGSTKTTWKLIAGNGEVTTISTSGMNPFFRTTEEMAAELEEKLVPVAGKNIDHVWFYGAGVVNEEKGAVVSRAISRLFPSAKIETYSDLLGACRALFGKSSGIACILGTGSNACVFDGEKIAAHVSPLGFILGDEGSGAVMGKHLLGDYFKEVMPVDLRRVFAEKYQLSRDEALNRVYREQRPNHFLATFVPFLSENLQHEYCPQFVTQNFRSFVERNIQKLPGYRELPVGFAGSVAWYFSDIMKTVLAEKGIENTKFLKDPIDGLVRFHTETK